MIQQRKERKRRECCECVVVVLVSVLYFLVLGYWVLSDQQILHGSQNEVLRPWPRLFGRKSVFLRYFGGWIAAICGPCAISSVRTRMRLLLAAILVQALLMPLIWPLLVQQYQDRDLFVPSTFFRVVYSYDGRNAHHIDFYGYGDAFLFFESIPESVPHQLLSGKTEQILTLRKD